jgi:Protein of unknown function (DUF2442)
MNAVSTLADNAESATFVRGEIVVRMKSGREFRFIASRNPRLSKGTPAQLANIELSPYGLHWPDLDEDLSYRGLLVGDFGYPNDSGPTKRRRRPRLDNRNHDDTGQIDKKHGNTRLKTLRKEYGQHLAPGRRGDMMLKTLRDEAGGKSLSQIFRT